MNAKLTRDYPLLLVGQFLGAFGDNFLLKAIVAPLTYQQTAGKVTEQYVTAQNSLFAAVFFVPFILLAPLAGFANDRMPKTTWLFGGNLLKLVGAVVGLIGITLHDGDFSGSRLWQVVGYAIVGIGACMYSPAKYGILPEIVPAARLVKANGTVEMLTLVAILSGIFCGGLVYDQVRAVEPCYWATIGLYGAALVFNACMKRTPANPHARFKRNVSEFASTLASLIASRRLGRILLGCAVFWFAGAILRNNMQGWGLQVFEQAGLGKVSNVKLNLLMVALIVGIVAGSMVVGFLHKIGDLTWARRYGFFMAGGIFLLAFPGGAWGVPVVLGSLVITGIAAGLLIVPLNAALQAESDQTKLGKTISIQNFVDYVAMLVGTGFLALLTHFKLMPTHAFAVVSVTLVIIVVGLNLRGGPAPTPVADRK